MTSQSTFKRPLLKQWNTAWMRLLAAIAVAFFSTPLLAQQTGDIAGTVTDSADNSAIAGVSIEAASPVLPGVRTSITSANGDYRLLLLPPGAYTIKYTLSNGTTLTRVTSVLLEQRTVVDLAVDFSVDSMVLEEVLVIRTSTIVQCVR